MQLTDLKELFEAVQMHAVLADGKTFPDCKPRFSLELIQEKYNREKHLHGFNLKKFVTENFELPTAANNTVNNTHNHNIKEHIETLWNVLKREPIDENSSLIKLPYAYIVPGSRFREGYYWDTYFTMLGLQVSQQVALIENMVNNFAYLIDTIGYVPNGNRTYYIGRSQPPFFPLMVQLLAEEKGKHTLIKYLPQLEKEYAFWQKGLQFINDTTNASHHVAMVDQSIALNRYWDENDTPRPESFKEDIELAHNSNNKQLLYRNIRAAAESGWDFSTRWFKEEGTFSSIHTTDIIPVDLNCLLVCAEEILAETYFLLGERSTAQLMNDKALKRKVAIQQYCWNKELGFYFDYDFVSRKQKKIFSLAAISTLFFKIATHEQAVKIASILQEDFLCEGGLLTTLNNSGQQWDAPNGWAPLQYMAIKGLRNYGLDELAADVAERWIDLNIAVYERTGKLMEKYNVEDIHLEAGGGEYPGQDGFGWTNGVLLKLMSMYRK